MPELVIENLSQKVIPNNPEKTVLQNIHASGTDWLFMCGGKGRCTTCKMIVLRGFENLSVLTESEKRYRLLKRLAENERLACQSHASGDVVFSCAEENKLPHMIYSS
jgi:2Fe-2S ferredoxin